MICIQRKIKKANNEILEEQEINVKIGKHNINKLYNILALYTILMIYNEKVQKKSKKITFYVDKSKKMLYNNGSEILGYKK